MHLRSAGSVRSPLGYNGNFKNAAFFPVDRDHAHSCPFLCSERALHQAEWAPCGKWTLSGIAVVEGDRCRPPGAVTPLPPAPLILTGPEVPAPAFLGTNCAHLQ